MAGDSSDSGSDLEEYMPSDNPEVTAALARAITDPDSEEDAISLIGRLSCVPSVANTDDDGHTDNEMSFTAGIHGMPAYDETDVQESADDLDIPAIASHQQAGCKQKEKDPPQDNLMSDIVKDTQDDSMSDILRFVPSHFDDSDPEVDKTLTHGLEFPDIEDVKEDAEDPAVETTDFVTQSVSSAMNDTLDVQCSAAGVTGHDPKGTSDIDEDLTGFEIMDETELENYREHDETQLDNRNMGASYFDWLRKK